MELRVLTWNLKHGRSVPGSGRDLLPEFGAALAGWEWDVALLQEVPPWWPAPLSRRLGACARLVLTSRNALLPLRRAVARRWPDAIKSNGGGANAILVRGERSILEHRTRRLCLLPERRWLHAVRLSCGVWGGNLHAGGTVREAREAGATALRWSGSEPLVLGGDFNLHSLSLEGLTWAGGRNADHVFVAGLVPLPGSARVLDRGRLSDHAPVVVGVAMKAPISEAFIPNP
jgi:endonuclease/exonuclease/phosphatase family metal-dependent hydrolase